MFRLEKAKGWPHVSPQLPQGESEEAGADLCSLMTVIDSREHHEAVSETNKVEC